MLDCYLYEKVAERDSDSSIPEEILQIKAAQIGSDRVEQYEKLSRCRRSVSIELQRCERSIAGHGSVTLKSCETLRRLDRLGYILLSILLFRGEKKYERSGRFMV